MARSILYNGQSDGLAPEEEKYYMSLIAAKDRSAFGKVVRVYMTDMYRFAYSMLGDSAKAEDVVQEGCLRVWQKADKWKPTGRLKPWLLSIVHNLCIDELRKKKNDVPLEKVILSLPDKAKSYLDRHADLQGSKIISEALFSLPERQRTALVLVYYHSYSNREAAEVMEVSVDALESLLSRGRRKLRELLANSKTILMED